MRILTHSLILLFAASSLVAADVETLFVIRELKGEMRVYSPPSGEVLATPEKHEDTQSDTVYIQREKESGKETFFVSHNNGRSKVATLVGEKSLTFIESYGDNNFIWTICLDKKLKDGSFLVMYASVKADGILGSTSSSIMSGRAYRPLQARGK